jgi:catechol 2,3-dioxygenase-like lactoylglutathione lyase family enzyme
MLDHVSLGVSDLWRSRRFYDAVLRPLGMARLLDFEDRGSDYGAMSAPLGVEFTITMERHVEPGSGVHLCFRAVNRQAVMDFHAAALREGGSDDGAPGLRAVYHANYFGAFVRDPDGHRIEAVCHLPSVAAIL